MIRWLTKKKLFAFHGWLGVTLGLPLFIICFSGACAVMSPELDRLIHPDMRIVPPADPAAAPLSWGALLGKVEAASPGGEVFLIDAADERTSAWMATVTYSPRDQRLVFFDPFTGEIRGQRTTFNAQSFFRIFHKQFYILGGKFWPHGRVIVCSFSIVLLLAATTGLMFYKGWWKSLLRLRMGKGARVFFSDLHRFIGVWTFLLAMLFAVTGFWYLLERLMEDFGMAEHDPIVEIPAEVRAARPPVMERLSLDELILRARQAYPELEIRTVLPGNLPGSVTTLAGEGPAMLSGGQTNRVLLDPHTGEIVQVTKANEMRFGTRLESLVNPLHFGRFGGVLTKIIWAGAGLALAVSILAGATISCLRWKSGGLSRRQRAWSYASLGLNVAILGLAAVSTATFIRAQIKGPESTRPRHLVGEATAGPWKVETFRDEHGGMSFRFVSPGDPNFREAYCWSGNGPRAKELQPMQGSRRVLSGDAGPDEPLRLEIVAWDGTVHAATFIAGRSAIIRPPEAPEVPAGLWIIPGVFFLAVILPCGWWLRRIR